MSITHQPSHNSSNEGSPVMDAGSKAKRRTPLSCAECRRLKLKCDRVWPCAQCKKRGCAQICPDGSLVPGKGNRFILAGTEELHDRIEALEDALSKATSPAHPLLKTSLYPYRSNSGDPEKSGAYASGNSTSTVRSSSPGSGSSHSRHDELLIDSVGTIAIGDDGHCKYFGNGAGSEFFAPFDDARPGRYHSSAHSSPVGAKPNGLVHGFAPAMTREQLRGGLPLQDEARALCRNFFQHAAWLYDVVNEQQFENDTFLPTYFNPSIPSPQRLALLYMVLSLGSLFDLSRPLYQPQAEQYYELAKACLRAEGGYYNNTTIPAVQALQLMTHYLSNSPSKGDVEVGWAELGSLVKVAQSMGLHRDARRWDFPEEELELRRKVFWEIHTSEVYTALCFGRPYSMHRYHIDCALPNDPTARHNPDGTVGFGFHTIKYFLCDKVMRIIDEVFCVTPPSYDTILQLDHDIRDFHKTLIPEYLRERDTGSRTAGEDVVILLQRHVITCFLNEALLYLHRGCFTRAIVENPDDPTQTRFSPSFVATHRSSSTIIRAVLDLAQLQPALVKRLTVYWFHAFSAAVVLASICIRSPRSPLAPSALQELGVACDFFAGAEHQSRAAQGLPTLRNLRSRAVRAMYNAGVVGSAALVHELPDQEHDIATHIKQEPDECALLGYRPRLDRTSPPRSRGEVPTMPHPVSNGYGGWAVAGQPAAPLPETYKAAHPALLEHYRRYNGGTLPIQSMEPEAMPGIQPETDYDDYVTRDGTAYGIDDFPTMTAQQAREMLESFSTGPLTEIPNWQPGWQDIPYPRQQ